MIFCSGGQENIRLWLFWSPESGRDWSDPEKPFVFVLILVSNSSYLCPVTSIPGIIDRKELKRLMKKLVGIALSEAELDVMFAKNDTDGNGDISFEEFTQMMVSQTF
jgi:hypothetical protein